MLSSSSAPIFVLNTNTQRETGRKAQLANIAAGKAVADILSSTLGPRSMLKMLIDPTGGIVMTNDGHAILREIDVKHPAAKSIIELARMQDEEVGDGTTSVVCLTGEMLQAARPFIEREVHPSTIVAGYFRALSETAEILNAISAPINLNDDADVRKALQSCVGTKFYERWGDTVVSLALTACRTVLRGLSNPLKLSSEIKRYAKVEKIPGGAFEECRVVQGVMLNKDVTHPGMRRRIAAPRVVLLDCPLEYKKAESQTNMEMTKETDLAAALQEEINEIAAMCLAITRWKPDVVVTEKGVSDLAQHYFVQAGVSVLRRVRKTDNNRIARVTGAKIVNRPDELQEEDVGTRCKLFEVRLLSDEYFAFFEECEEPSACSIVLRGGSKDSLNELERNLHDALGVARNLFVCPRVVPGGGATEMELSHRLQNTAINAPPAMQKPIKAVALALEAIPRILTANCGANVVRVLTELRAKHAEEGGLWFGVDGKTGQIADMRELNVWEPYLVKSQVIKTAIESCCMLLRIDDVVSGIKKKQPKESGLQNMQGPEAAEAIGEA